MKLLGYFVWAAAVFAVIFAQDPNGGDGEKNNNQLKNETIEIIKNCTKENLDANAYPNATLAIEDAFLNAVNSFSESEDIIRDALSKAKSLILEDPKAAKKIALEVFNKVQLATINNAGPSFEIFGNALYLSNERSRQKLDAACRSSQNAGYSLLNTLSIAENLLNRGLDAGGKASLVLLEAGQFAADTGYAAAYRNIQKSVRKACQAIKDAQSKPMQDSSAYPNTRKCTKYASNETVSIDAINKIDEDADKALKRGANAIIVQKLSDVLKCATNDVVKIVNKATRNANELKTIADSEPTATIIRFFDVVESARKRIHDVATQIYIVLGEVSPKSSAQSNNDTIAAITSTIIGETEVALGIRSVEILVTLGVGHPGVSPAATLEATAKVGVYCKFAFIQAIVKASKLAFSVL